MDVERGVGHVVQTWAACFHSKCANVAGAVTHKICQLSVVYNL